MQVFNLAPLFISLSVRLLLRDSVFLAVLDTTFLIILTSCYKTSWTVALVVLGFYLGVAVLHTYFHYFGWRKNTDSHANASHFTSDFSASGHPKHHDEQVLDHRDSTCLMSQSRKRANTQQDAWCREFYNGRVMMFPCTLRHSRRSGFKGDYRQSYLYVGCPVGLRANYSSLLTVQPDFRPTYLLPFKSSWFSIRPEDHALNGGATLTMVQKLEEFLLNEVSQSCDIVPCDCLSIFHRERILQSGHTHIC
jgi:hypothetical protein